MADTVIDGKLTRIQELKSALDDVAERRFWGVFGGDVSGLFGQPLEVALHRFESCDALAELGRVALDEGHDVPAGRLASVPERESFPDLAQAEANGLSGTDEVEASGGLLVIVPVSAVRPAGGGHEADPLVVADGRWLYSGPFCQLSDAHRAQNNPLTF
jgi:hypothetical protein